MKEMKKMKDMNVIRHRRSGAWTAESIVYTLIAVAALAALVGAVLGWY